MFAAAADPSLLNSTYVLPPDYETITETAEVFMKAMLLGLEPETDKTNFADSEPVEILPYEEALAYMRKKLPVDKETYYSLDDKMRYRAFTVSRLADGDAVRRVQDMLAGALDEGKSLSQFLQMTEGELADAVGMGRGAGWYYETVYRTNTATAYNVGRAIGYEETPPVALELIGIDDTRQTETCHALTVPPFRRKYNDPIWETLWPPLHFNCRTTVRAIYDEAEIDEAGGPDKFYSKGAPDYTPAEGFGAYPVDKSDSWWDLTDAMRERAEEYRLEIEFLEAREQLIEPGNTPENNPAEVAEIKKAEAYARDNLGIDYADYTGIDSRVANEWNQHLANTLQEFPELRERIKFTGSIEAQNKLIEPILDAMRLEIARREHPGMPEKFILAQAEIGRGKDLSLLAVPDNMLFRNISPANDLLKPYGGIGINPKVGSSLETVQATLHASVRDGKQPMGTASLKGAHDHEIAHQLDHLLNLRNDPDMVALWDKYTESEKTTGLSEYGAKDIKEFISTGWTESRNNPGASPLSKEIESLMLEKYTLWKKRNL